MRKLPPVLAISAAVHAAGLAWLSAYTRHRVPLALPRPEQAPTVVEIVPAAPPALPPVPDVPPVDVAFLDEATAAQIPSQPPPGATRTAPRIRTTAGAASTAAATTEAPAGTGSNAAPGSRNPYLDMRRPGAPRIELPKLEWTPDMPPGPPPPKDVTTGQLQDSGGGTKRSDQGVFVAHVDADGTVKIKDRKNFHIKIALPSAKDLGRLIADWYLDPNKPVGELPPDHIERPPVIDDRGTRDPGTGQDDKPDHGRVSTVPIVSGGFDVSDALMRSHGQDPYASKKLAFLDSTRAERVQMGMRHRSEQLAMAPAIMRKNLLRLWASVADPAERREALFELWDESAEAGTEELVAAGLQARLLVIGWIRAKLPAGSPDAYTADEIAALNKRRTSRAAFEPY